MAEQRDKAASGAIKTNAGVSIIPSSKRADGSVRKAVKVRPVGAYNLSSQSCILSISE